MLKFICIYISFICNIMSNKNLVFYFNEDKVILNKNANNNVMHIFFIHIMHIRVFNERQSILFY